jgi:general secretion pathway protein G
MRRTKDRGLTFVEMLATIALLMIVASVILPVAKTSHKRQKEIELRRALREIRTAIDQYHNAVLAKLIGGMDVKLGSEGYPPNLEALVEGVNRVGAVDRKLKFLRRIPVDPMTGTAEWGLRCYQDEPDSTSWCGDNVWDVYTKSDAKALNGTKYSDW